MKLFPRGDRAPSAEEMLDRPDGRPTVSAAAGRELWALIRRHRAEVALGVCLTLVSRLAGLVLPASTKYFIDGVIVEARRDLLLPLVGLVAVATIVQAASGFALARLLGVAAQRAVADLRRGLAAHVLRLPVSRFDSTHVGALTSRILSDPDGIRNLLGSGLAQLLGGAVTATAALVVLVWLDWRMTLVMTLFLAALGGGVAWAFTRLRPINRQRSLEFARVSARLGEALGGIRVLKAYVAERREDAVLTRGIHRMLRLVVASLSGWAAVGALTTLAVGGIGATLMLMGGQAVLDGALTVGELTMYTLFTGLVAAPLVQIAQIGTQLSEGLAGLERARELLDEPREDSRPSVGASLPRLTGRVRLEDVSFHYTPGVPVLSGVTLTAEAGTTTALVGASGSGKSTLLGLLAAFHRPTAGSILVDGLDLSAVDLHAYRSQIGLVLQETFLFDGTILENIRFSRPGAPVAEVQRVAALANCHEFAQRLPQGYQTVVGERGVRLSGGQRQRVAIARALLVDPALLLLDEATSSLDSESEALIQQGLETLRRGRTTFVIAHRLSTIVGADQIVVLDGGRVVECGPHEALLARGGRYAALYDRQRRAVRDRFVNPGEELEAVD